MLAGLSMAFSSRSLAQTSKSWTFTVSAFQASLETEEVEPVVHSDSSMAEESDHVNELERELLYDLDARIKTLGEIRIRRDAAQILEIDSVNAVALTTLAFLDVREWMRVRNGVSYRDVPMMLRDPFDLDEVKQKGGTIYEVHTEADGLKSKAIERLEAALKSDPRNPSAASLLASICIVDNDLDCLDALIKQLQLYQARNPLTDFLAGYAANTRGNPELADNHFLRAFSFLPTDLVEQYQSPGPIKELGSNALIVDTSSFWSAQDIRLLTPTNERWTEHLSRIVYAELAFSDWEVATSGYSSARGNIWIRYGAPTRDVNLFQPMEVNAARDRVGSAFHVIEYPDARFVLAHPTSTSSTDYDHYAPPADFFQNPGAVAQTRDYVIKAREQIRENPERFTTDAPGRSRVEFPYQLSRFRSRSGDDSMDVIVSMAVQIPFIPNRGDLSMGLRTGLFAVGANSRPSMTTTREWDRLGATSLREINDLLLWNYSDILTRVPSDATLSIEFETAESGAVFGHHRNDTTSDPIVTDGFGMSDILIARMVEDRIETTTSAHTVDRGDLTIHPAAIALFSTGDPIYLYFETYAHPEQQNEARYEVSAALADRNDDRAVDRILSRIRGRGRDNQSIVTFELDAESATTAHYFILDSDNHPPGDYWIVMEITNLISNETTSSRRAVTLY